MKLSQDRAFLLGLTAELGYLAFWSIAHSITVLVGRAAPLMSEFQYGVFSGPDACALLVAFLLAPLGAYLMPWIFMRLPWGTRVGLTDQIVPCVLTIAAVIYFRFSAPWLYGMFTLSAVLWPFHIVWFVSKRA